MRRLLTSPEIISLLVFAIVGCDLFMPTDLIVGGWQLVSENGAAPVFVTVVQFTENTYTGSTAGIETHGDVDEEQRHLHSNGDVLRLCRQRNIHANVQQFR